MSHIPSQSTLTTLSSSHIACLAVVVKASGIMPKHECRFTEELGTEFPFIKNKYEQNAHCDKRWADFSVAHSGHVDITKHVSSVKHKQSVSSWYLLWAINKNLQARTCWWKRGTTSCIWGCLRISYSATKPFTSYGLSFEPCAEAF